MIYWICFLLSCLFLYVGEKKKKNRIFLTSIGLLFPTLLAAFRSVDVGTDVRTYLLPIFNIASSSSNCKEFLFRISMTAMDGRELGYCILIYLVTKLTYNINIVFMVIELLLILPIIHSINIFSKLKEISLMNFSKTTALLVYLAMFYNLYLSATRFGLAFSFSILSVIMFMAGKKGKSILFGIIATSFHHSGIFVFVLLFLYHFCKNKYKTIIRIFIFWGIVFALFYEKLFPLVMKFFQQFGLLSQKYIGWQSGTFYATAPGGVNVTVLIYTIYALLISLFLYRKDKNSITRFLLITNIFMLCLTPFIASYDNFGRINTYFRMFSIFILPMFLKINPFRICQSVSKAKLAFICNFLFLLMYWIITYKITDFTNTSTYYFFWQKVLVI